MGRPTRLQSLEKKFSLAETLVEELDSCIQEFELDTDYTPSTEVIDADKSILDMGMLKQDFGMIRSNIVKLVATGQRILESASELDIGDLKASQLDALSNLQATIGSNLQLMMNIYESIAKIEKSRQKPTPKSTPEQLTAINGNVVNNNIAFSGSSSELLQLFHTGMNKA
jgi:hypothetical protein